MIDGLWGLLLGAAMIWAAYLLGVREGRRQRDGGEQWFRPLRGRAPAIPPAPHPQHPRRPVVGQRPSEGASRPRQRSVRGLRAMHKAGRRKPR